MPEDHVGALSRSTRQPEIAQDALRRHLHLVSGSRRHLCPKPPQNPGNSGACLRRLKVASLCLHRRVWCTRGATIIFVCGCKLARSICVVSHSCARAVGQDMCMCENYSLSWTEHKNVCLFCRRHDSGRIMSGGAPKGPRMATLEKQNKQREDNDAEFKQKRLASFQSFFARAVRTSENPLTHPGTPPSSTQTVSAAPTVTMLPIPLTPSLRVASLPSALDATTLLKPLTPSLGPASVLSAANEIMEDSPVVIPFTSPHSSQLQQHNSPVRPYSHEDRFTVGYPPVPKTRAGRIDDAIYFNHATQRPMC